MIEVAGGHPEHFTICATDEGIIIKETYMTELNFYEKVYAQ